MAGSRKPKPGSRAAIDLAAHVAARLKTTVAPGERVVLGLSGGIDSAVLLDVLARVQKRLHVDLRAVHVNHQLSPNAAAWARFCRRIAAERGIACKVARVDVARGNSVERAAREVRYEALSKAGADVIALAHNADDQAETVLLQLLRGAGVKGLAAMPLRRKVSAGMRDEGARRTDEGGGTTDEGVHVRIVRPLLDVPRSEIAAYAHARKVTWIEDESNLDASYLRNWLRRDIVPLIAARVPGYRATLTRAALHFAEAAVLLDDLGRLDAGDALESGAIPVGGLRALSPARARNLLRAVIGARGWPMPQATRLEEALRQALQARGDARLLVDLGGCELRRRGDGLHLVAPLAAEGEMRAVTWRGERSLSLPHLGGVLTMILRRGSGLSIARLNAEPVTIRARQGGERVQPDPKRPTRTVKNLLQEAGVPSWARERLPFIYCGEVLAAIPGVATDYRFFARRGEPSVVPGWKPLSR